MNYRPDNIRQMPLNRQQERPNAPAPAKRRRKLWNRVFTLGIGLDMYLLIAVLILLGIGLVTLFSASYAYGYYYEGDSYAYIRKQGIFAIGGVIAMLFISTFNYRNFQKLAWPFFIGYIGLLAVVLVFKGTSIVPQINGAYRWISIGPIQFQASEVAKFGIVVALANILSRQTDEKNYTKKVFIPAFAVLAITVVLIIAEKHISATIIICIISAIVMLIGGIKFRWFAGLGALGAAALGVVITNSDNFAYALRRIQGWLSPFNPPDGVDTYQTVQSLYAIGSGGLLGLGFGNSRQKYLFLPEPQNDFIFAVYCEETGFVGACLVIVLFIFLVYRGYKISLNARDRFGALLGLGITFTIGLQAALNICVVTGVIPNTGISLPFFSYGGTSLLMLLGEVGVLLSISRNNYNDTTRIEQQIQASEEKEAEF